MSTSAIKINDLVKKYESKSGSKLALDNINLEVPQGSFFGLLGPNGAGKSTLINILAGLTNKTSGTVCICGYDITTTPKQAKHSIGVVPQELVLDPFFPPFEALENTAGYYGIPKKQRRTMEIIEALGLQDKAFSPSRKLSGGMRRRLLIAKALVHAPKVLVLDEPTAGVDVDLRRKLWNYVKLLNKEHGTTILLTTHYLEEAETLCDKIAVINHGKIISNDSTKNLMKIIDRKKVTIQAKEKLTKIPNSLKGFDIKILDNGNLEINYRSGEMSFANILSAISNAKIDIHDLSTQEADLEEVFQHLTTQKIS